MMNEVTSIFLRVESFFDRPQVWTSSRGCHFRVGEGTFDVALAASIVSSVRQGR